MNKAETVLDQEQLRAVGLGLYDHLAHSIAELKAAYRDGDRYDQGYLEALLDLARVFYPEHTELWKRGPL
jgi:hypothetical protein